jgi:tetratricopeptide (TPR) repeat protein
VAIGVCAILAVASLASGRHLGSDATLWRREVDAEPCCREGQFYLGEVARQARQWDEAATRYELALAVTPNVLAFAPVVPALQNLGAVRLEQGRFAEAATVLRQALADAQGEDRQRELTHDLATALLQAGDAEQAARLLEPEVARPDAFAQSILVRARALHQLGREDEARALVRRLRQDRARQDGDR